MLLMTLCCVLTVVVLTRIIFVGLRVLRTLRIVGWQEPWVMLLLCWFVVMIVRRFVCVLMLANRWSVCLKSLVCLLPSLRSVLSFFKRLGTP